MVELIQKKRGGGALSRSELRFLVEGFVKGEIPDYQISAWLMAVFFQGMSEREGMDFTLAMVASGDTIDLSSICGMKVDKHSTGGVGDTTTLVLAPLVAALGVPVAKMSGRGLGFTGGTLDKLESIPGFSTEMSEEKFFRSVNEIGVAVMGQSAAVVPADRLLYALRDVTATVESIPLIASSVMSKKIASGADALVLDVTVGSGAFVKQVDEATKLAKYMVRMGQLAGRKTVAVLSDMSQPLGNAIGNALEVVEAIHTLQGNGPKDLENLVLVLGAQMVLLAGGAVSEKEARKKLRQALRDGRAFAKFQELVKNQGGQVEVLEQPEKWLKSVGKIPFVAKTSGYIERIETEQLGRLAMRLGAGRKTKTDAIDPKVGFFLHKKVGDFVVSGEPILSIYSNQTDCSEICLALEKCFDIGENKRELPLIHGMIQGEEG